ncbi:MAG TPA: hypothetical protein DDW50_12795, partial [Firmicutes bacterium]|nr:hypothetical protein [Bacillota bacterium]
VFADDKPEFVLSSVHLDVNDGGKLVPEIAVNSDGTWRKATLKDVWAGQEFELFDQTKDPILQRKVIVNSLNSGYCAGCDAKDNLIRSGYYWGIYKAKQQFRNVGLGKEIKPKYFMNKTALKILSDKKKSINGRLQDVIREDWKKIHREFPKLRTSNIFDFMIGDINGDQKNDYILLLSDMEHVKGAAVFIYFSNGRNYGMVPINFWKDASFSTSWPRLFFMMDFNGDGTKEIVITDADSDSNYPSIYGWFRDSKTFRTLYNGKEPLCAW